ncbi:MAG: hypothetical protein GQ544_01315 [Candidatus Aminicenantes bacterium]|nr:hypothetical protein [Candidatus Aminicenantes bacterium]
MKKISWLLIFMVLLGMNWAYGEETAVAHWTFDGATAESVLDAIKGTADSISGNFRVVTGVSGEAVKFDGYTTMVTKNAAEVPALDSGFTLEAWVALAAFPWSWCPVITHTQDNAGYALEIGPAGEVAVKVFSGSAWRTCISLINIPIKSWTHVAGVFDPETGLTVFINGRKQGHLEFRGRLTPARRTDLVLGSVPQPAKPAYIHRPFGTLPGWYSLDAILDEVKIHDHSLSGTILHQRYVAAKPSSSPEIPPRVLPSGPSGPGRFGAYYTHLKYHWEWDDMWRTAEHPDVVIQFDDSPVRVVFWRGTRYSPAWVTDNNLWMADQSVEAWNDEEGCFEHMQDRHCRYSHVRITENTPARVVVHWRYAPISAHDNFWRVDPRTGWGCWVDEYYYFYPDRAGIRKYTWEKDSLGRPRQFQETIPLTGPGQTQGDVIHEEYVTIANLAREKQTFSYIENPPQKTGKPIPSAPMIQMHNLKARNKPFIIFEPGGDMLYLKDMNIEALSRSGSCSHWPIGQMCCDGRTQRTTDRAASFLGFPITDPVIHEKGNRSWVSSLYGLNDESFDRLLPLAKSWIHAPKLRANSGSVKCQGYNFSQRAYKLENTDPQRPSADLVFEATPDSPFRNACLVIKNWGDFVPQVQINGKLQSGGKDYRLGQVRSLEGTDLLVWISKESDAQVVVTLSVAEE